MHKCQKNQGILRENIGGTYFEKKDKTKTCNS